MQTSALDHHPVTLEVLRLFHEHGSSQYGGESVSQEEHAVQSAFFAERGGAGSTLIAAALLHDIGHLLHNLPDDAPEHGIDDAHEVLAADWLGTRFGAEVVQPVLLHVAAKRYLCATDPDYAGQLSHPSIVSLRLQGGPMSEEEARKFQTLPFHEAALSVRRCDDAAKVPELVTPPLEHYAVHLDRALQERGLER